MGLPSVTETYPVAIGGCECTIRFIAGEIRNAPDADRLIVELQFARIRQRRVRMLRVRKCG